MSSRYIFNLQSDDRRRLLPNKIIVGRRETETERHVLLKFIAYVLFFREGIQIEPRLHDDNIPFLPDIVAFDYSLRPSLWVECGECSVAKLDRLAVKVPDAAIWIVRRSTAEVDDLTRAMAKAELRTDRYDLIGLDLPTFEELSGLLTQRNEVTWFSGTIDPPLMQFEFNGLWFDTEFTVQRF